MRRLSLLLIVFILLTACTTTQEPQTVRVGVLLYAQDDVFLGTLVHELEQYARDKEEELGVKINLALEYVDNNQSQQYRQIDLMLSQGYDVLCVNVVDRTAASTIIDRAKEMDVPLVFFNREPVQEDLERFEDAYYVGSPAANAGILQGEIVLDAWRENPEQIDKNLDGVIQYVMLEGEQGHQDALLRTEYSVQVLTQAGVPLEKLASASANWQRAQATDRVTQWIDEMQSENEIELILANNDDMALGALDAYFREGYNNADLPFVVGVDATSPALDALEQGILQGTVHNDGILQAQTILQLALELVMNGAPQSIQLTDDRYAWLDYTSVTLDTLQDFREDTGL